MISLEKETKLKTLLGLARRSGQLESGVRNVEKCIYAERIQVLIIADDATKNVFSKMSFALNTNKVRSYTALDKVSLGDATGQSEKAVVGIHIGKLAEAIISLMDN